MPRPLWPHQKSYIHIFSSFNFPSSAKDLRPRTFYFELLFLLRPCLIFISPLNRARKKPSLASPNLSLSFSHRISLPICSPFTVFLSAKVAPNKCPPPPTHPRICFPPKFGFSSFLSRRSIRLFCFSTPKVICFVTSHFVISMVFSLSLSKGDGR